MEEGERVHGMKMESLCMEEGMVECRKMCDSEEEKIHEITRVGGLADFCGSLDQNALLSSTLTAYLTPYAPLVHQGKGTSTQDKHHVS